MKEKNIAQLNCISHGLHFYLSTRHEFIFDEEESKKMDYAVAYYNEEQAKEYIKKIRNGGKKLPKPFIEYFDEIDEAYELLGKNHFTALSWRHSPKLELMY